MVRNLRVLLALFCSTCLLGVAVPANVADAKSKNGKASAVAGGAGAAEQIVAITNRERVKHGLSPLTIDRHCVSAIGDHVADMAKRDFLSHEGSDGRSPNERYRKYKPGSPGASENVAYNRTGTGASFMEQWMSSSGHRENILKASHKGIGVAVRANCASGAGKGKCTYYAGQCFSRDR